MLIWHLLDCQMYRVPISLLFRNEYSISYTKHKEPSRKIRARYLDIRMGIRQGDSLSPLPFYTSHSVQCTN